MGEENITIYAKACCYITIMTMTEKTTMNVLLRPQLEHFVKQKVNTGLYNSASEVLREALRLLEEQDNVKQHKLDALRKDLDVGLEQLDRGEGGPVDIEKIKARGRERLKQEKNQ
ncbi:MAG: antitoxin ParD1/3/4 [Candidatus Endobugula sp.]